MNQLTDSLAYWLADYYLATTVLLAAALLAIRLCRQPVKRLAVVKSVLVAIALLAGLCALPHWSVISLVTSNAAIDAEPVSVAEVAPEDSRQITISAGNGPGEPLAAPPIAASATVTPTVREPISWPSVAVAAYLVGSVAVVLWLTFGAIAARRLVQRADAAPARLSEMLTRIGSNRVHRAQLLVSDEIDVAVAIGVTRPAIVLPSRWVDDRSAEELQTVLAHEVAHVRHGDLKWLAVSRILLILAWAQPLYWLLRRSLRLNQEMLADAAAAECSDRQQYAEQLVAWARGMTCQSRLSLPAALGLWEGPSQLRRRVGMLLDERLMILRRCSRTWVVLTTLIAVVLAALLSLASLEPSSAARTGQEPSDSGSARKRSDSPTVTAQEKGVAANELAGQVTDEAGRPLTGVTVDAWTWFPGNETITDDSGRFSLKGFDPREPVELQFTKSGFCPRLFIAQPVGKADWVVTLNNRSYLEGRVLAPDGQPIAGINIRATRGPFDVPDGSMITAVWTETETGADGHYRMYLEPGTYELRVRQPGVGVARYENTVVRENDRREFDLRLESGPVFRARVIDSQSGEPVAGIRLFKWREPGIVGSSTNNGELKIANMLPGQYEFNVSANIEKSRFPHVAGEYARWWSPDAIKAWQRLDLTDRGEGFQRNFDGLEFDVREGMGPVTIVVERGVKIRGLVVDPVGKPVEGATVAPAKTGSGNSLTGDTRYSVRTAADGTFAMRLPASGAAKYNLVAHDGDYEEWRTWANGIGELMQTKPGDVVENVRLQLSRPCVVRGRVDDANGRPVAKHRVRAQAADKRESRYYDPTTETNERGEFELRFVRPGKHYIQAEPFWLTAEQGPKSAWRIVEANPDRPVEGVELHLEAKDRPTGRLDLLLQELGEKGTGD